MWFGLFNTLLHLVINGHEVSGLVLASELHSFRYTRRHLGNTVSVADVLVFTAFPLIFAHSIEETDLL